MKYTKEIAVGLSLVIAAVIFVLGVRYFEDLPLFHGTYELNTTFDDAGGLADGSAVLVNGVRVGAIDEVRLDTETNKVLVRFHVDETVSVSEGSYSSLGGIAALGTVHMSVNPGEPGNPRIREGGFIPSRTSANLLESMSARAPELVDNLEAFLVNANQTFEEAEVLFRQTNPNLQHTLAAYRESGEALSEMIRAERQNISELITSLREFSGDMNRFSSESTDTLSAAVQKFNSSMSRLETTLDKLDTSTDELNSILTKIDEGDGTLAQLLNDPGAYQKLDSTVTILNSLLEEFKNDPKKYLRHMSLVRIF